MLRHRHEHIDHIGLEQGEHDLRFRVAHARVEFEHLRLPPHHHQPRVQHTLEGAARTGKAFNDRLEDRPPHPVKQFARADRRGRIRTHAARVGARIPVTDPLVVLGGRQRNDGLPVGEGHDR